MDKFSIAPWEHRGSGASTAAGARVEAELGGHKRHFLLKMREGVIYFREPKSAPMWAITRVFERELSGAELIEAWQAEIARDNYGRYLLYTPYLFGGRLGDNVRSGTQTALGLVHRADYSGWAREWFDDEWREIPAHRDGRKLDVWGKSWSDSSKRAFGHVQADLIERALPASKRIDISTQWIVGDETELRRVFGLAVQLFLRSSREHRGAWRCTFAASNPLCAGGWTWMFSAYHRHELKISPAWKSVVELIEQHFAFTGMTWHHREVAPDARNPDYVTRQRERFGADWRGDWGTTTREVNCQMEPIARISAHEKLEATLQLRDWLEDKVSPRLSKSWLDKALD